ncbi:hypothetical protein [Prosthecobacter sp.]|uniref:hypothetical protein n=1 Tax=Prosthecobacter sp. TaxID=1965333 RepID=UPI0037843B4E
MARTPARFEDVFRDFVVSLGGIYEETQGAEKATLLRHFNAGYRAAWKYEGVPWEDSWEEGTLTVTDGMIDYGDIDDAHVFNLWTTDPRRGPACWVDATTAKSGVFVGTNYPQVFGFWRPPCPQFTGTDPDAPLIAILTDATLAFAQAEHWRGAGQYETGGARRKDAKDLCDELAAVEFTRLQSKWWLRKKD